MSVVNAIKATSGKGNFLDLSGKTFGRLSVIRGIGTNCRGQVVWECECECGGWREVTTKDLKGGRVSACANCPPAKDKQVVIALLRMRWSGIKARCYNQKSSNYHLYGGRGIKVCERWLSSFESFLADMGLPPTPGHSIDRIDNGGDYEPGNCRWATRSEQSRNRRSNIVIKYGGETKTLVEWSEILELQFGLVHYRIKTLKWSPDRAFTEPIDATRRVKG